ncbi:Imm21 family immunity protein [Streptomyces sp. NBC_01443]|uniref:Imm21 family immunity protein n=1 Tax=Streptomyces sp. NBC_01443 TaxID=2903868 RepID=UPI002B1CD5FB|nr:Imm21 family immunity protein [Streptomyces sp. NBC_01443]
MLGDEPATTCYLPEQRIFLRWLAADSDTELLAAAEAVLSDPATPWEECGVWETDGPAVLMDSAEAGKDVGVRYPDGRGQPDEAPVAVAAGRWEVRACHKTGEFPWVGIVPLLPAVAQPRPTACPAPPEHERSDIALTAWLPAPVRVVGGLWPNRVSPFATACTRLYARRVSGG